MTRTARIAQGNPRSIKTLPASTWNQLKPKPKNDLESKPKHEKAEQSFRFGDVKKPGKDKEERSEERRLKRVVKRENAQVCFHCREEGHRVADCPQMKSQEAGPGLCFKCGSTEHSLDRCRAKVPDGKLPYAKCFICNEMGHLSKSCPDNPRGLYPMGGSCDHCGSVEHLKKDCTETRMANTGLEDIAITTMDAFTRVDEEPAFIHKPEPKPAKKTVKVVKF